MRAIVDFHYGQGAAERMGTEEMRYALQLIAELGVGTLLRKQQAVEDARYTRTKDVMGL